MNPVRRLRARYGVTTPPLRTERRVEAALILLLLLLLVQLAWGFMRLSGQSSPEAVEPAADTLQLASSPDVGSVSAAHSNDIRSRPLLWPSRRPAGDVVKVAEAKPEKATDFDSMQLVGVFGAGESAGMIVRVKGKPQRLRLGDDLAGWTLDAVTEQEAVLKKGARRKTLALEVNKAR